MRSGAGMDNKTLKLIYVVLGVFFISIVTLQRLPGIYSGLWEDEIHHNEPILAFSRLSGIRKGIAMQNKPLLDYAVRKLIFTKKVGIPPSERDIQTIALVW